MSVIHPVLDPIDLGTLRLANRAAVAPMSRVSTAGDGVPTEAMARCYAEFAEGGFGLVIAEGTYFDHAHSQAYLDQPGLVTDAQVEGWRAVVDAVHAHDGRIVIQLMHAGALVQGNAYRPQAIAPSVIAPKGTMLRGYGGSGGPYAMPRAATVGDLREVVAGVAAAAARRT